MLATLIRQELATGLAGQNIDLVPVFDCLASGQPEVGDSRAEYISGSNMFSCGLLRRRVVWSPGGESWM